MKLKTLDMKVYVNSVEAGKATHTFVQKKKHILNHIYSLYAIKTLFLAFITSVPEKDGKCKHFMLL